MESMMQSPQWTAVSQHCLTQYIQVTLLSVEGGADAWVTDRWGKTPYDEARRVGATAVADFLTAEMAKHPESAASSSSLKP